MSDKKKHITKQLKLLRAARRQVEIDMQLPKETSKIWKTSKKDRQENKSNNIKRWEDE